MTSEIAIVLLMLALTTFLFVRETFRVDLVALLIMSLLVLTGILSPIDAISGFANQATLTVGAMFVLSAGLQRTGALNSLAQWLIRVAGQSERRLSFALMSVVAIISGFINNTAAVAVFLPITIRMAEKLKRSPSHLLMPLSFAAMFGGTCTLIGTSTNILVSSMAEERGVVSFSMFAFLPLGVVYVVIGIGYMLFIGRRLLPDRIGEEALADRYELREYLTEVVLLEGSPMVGHRIEEVRNLTGADLQIVSLVQGGRGPQVPGRYQFLQAGDMLMISGSPKTIMRVRRLHGWRLLPEQALGDMLLTHEYTVAETMVAPGSRLVGQTLRSSGFRRRYGAMVIGIQHHGRLVGGRLASVPLQVGDLLLVYGPKEDIWALRDEADLLLLQNVPLRPPRSRKAPFTLAVIVAVVALAALNLVPIVVSAVMGCIALVLGGVQSLDESYEALDAPVLVMLAGILSLGVAMDQSGAAAYLADQAVQIAGPYGPYALLATLYLLTMLLTSIMSNNATAALLTPLAISLAAGYGVSPLPFLVAVALAASSSFITPIGYQTNTMVYGPGGYRFFDYTRVGAPLNLVLWILSVILIPIFWPF